jgi:hypothetical protein
MRGNIGSLNSEPNSEHRARACVCVSAEQHRSEAFHIRNLRFNSSAPAVVVEAASQADLVRLHHYTYAHLLCDSRQITHILNRPFDRASVGLTPPTPSVSSSVTGLVWGRWRCRVASLAHVGRRLMPHSRALSIFLCVALHPPFGTHMFSPWNPCGPGLRLTQFLRPFPRTKIPAPLAAHTAAVLLSHIRRPVALPHCRHR